MKLKKTSRKFALFLLVAGASLILGLLSFGGMFALWPILPLAFATFALSIVYEMEIYFQNIQGAWNKLFKHNSLKRQLAKDFLLEHFPPDTTTEDCPQFFKDYDLQLKLLNSFGHGHLNKANKAKKKKAEKTLRDMEKLFALELFDGAEFNDLEYETQLQQWLNSPEQLAKRTAAHNLHGERHNSFWWAKQFSILAGIFMGLGTTYLLVETFSTIPLLAALPLTIWPALILPMAAIAGAAYGLLTYNAVTDMITDDTLREWLKDLGLLSRDADEAPKSEHHHHHHDCHEEHEEHGKPDVHEHHAHGHDHEHEHESTAPYLKPIIGWPLVLLAIGLTICTAGTWWTIVKETRPLFAWMVKIPRFIMGFVNPTITSLSAVVFNLQNTRESLGVILEMIPKIIPALKYGWDILINGFSRLRQRENLGQVFNPARLVLIATIIPLRIILFLGHLISIGVTADRLPGVSQRVSALLGFISELFEDLHYFFGHDHHHAENLTPQELRQERLGKGHGHNHDLDIPTKLLEWLLTPLSYLSVWWDFGFSQLNQGSPESKTPYQLSFDQSKKKAGFEIEEDLPVTEEIEQPSSAWTLMHTIYRIMRYMEKHDVDEAERVELGVLQETLRRDGDDPVAIMATLELAKNKLGDNQQRFFKSGTVTFLGEELPSRIGFARSAG